MPERKIHQKLNNDKEVQECESSTGRFEGNESKKELLATG